MSTTTKTDAVWFTTKGQVVIPAWLRRELRIEDGTKAIIEATPEGILLKPVTKHAISRLHGILKRKPGGKPFAEEWAEHKREEKALAEAGYGLHDSRWPCAALAAPRGTGQRQGPSDSRKSC